MPVMQRICPILSGKSCLHWFRFAAGPANSAANRRDCVAHGPKLGEVVAVAARRQEREWDAVSFGDHMVLRSSRPRSTGEGLVYCPFQQSEADSERLSGLK